jgi:isopenicillin-N epimerase
MIGSMITVPLPASAGTTEEDATRLRLQLLLEDRIEVAMHAADGRIWARVSAQVYNDLRDVERFGEAVGRRA